MTSGKAQALRPRNYPAKRAPLLDHPECLCKIMARPAITGKCGLLKRWKFFVPEPLFKTLSLFQDVAAENLKKVDFFKHFMI